MGPTCLKSTQNRILLQFFLLLAWCSPIVFSDCKVQLCSRQYSRATEEDRIEQGATYKYCSVLRAYSECVRATGRSCRGDLAYHSVQSLLNQWTRTHDCERILEKGPGQSVSINRPPHRFQKPPRPHGECSSYRPAAPYSHCALFGDPHLRTFYDELQTCSVLGAWPLIDNPHLAVQVTNEPVGKGLSATAITKVTVIIRQHGPCAQEKTYEAQTDFLPSVFLDGSRISGPGVRIREESPGRHIEIHLRYIATRLVIRQVGRYLTFAAKMPSAIALQGAQSSSSTLELCIRGCPRRERIDFQKLLEQSSAPKQEAIAACKQLNVTDFYFDACVFDLLTTGDGSFSAAARDAMIDAGGASNGTISVVPRGLESSSGAGASQANLIAVVVLMVLLAVKLKDR